MVKPNPLVVVVDDEPAIRIALGRGLRSAGYDVETLDGAAAYLQCPPPRRPACLILDLRMPGMSGLDLARAIHGTKHGLPVVFLTGDHGGGPDRDAATSGVVDTLRKPPNWTRLLDAIDRALHASSEPA
jgi:FixJ family two-component response regulator